MSVQGGYTGRSKRSSTIASSKATEGLLKQRAVEPLILQNDPDAQANSGDCSNASTVPAKSKRRRRRSQGWSRPAQRRSAPARSHALTRKPRTSKRRSNKKRARCTFPGGLETFPHQPCTSAYGGFTDGEVLGVLEETPIEDDFGRSPGKLAWLRPRRTMSIWEELVQRRDAKPAATTTDTQSAAVVPVEKATREVQHCEGQSAAKPDPHVDMHEIVPKLPSESTSQVREELGFRRVPPRNQSTSNPVKCVVSSAIQQNILQGPRPFTPRDGPQDWCGNIVPQTANSFMMGAATNVAFNAPPIPAVVTVAGPIVHGSQLKPLPVFPSAGFYAPAVIKSKGALSPRSPTKETVDLTTESDRPVSTVPRTTAHKSQKSRISISSLC
jgi:hypothetical protein